MRALLCAITLLLLAGYSFGQKIPHVYQIRADTVRIYNTCDTAELVLENRTKDTLGFLFNKGKGRTEFHRLGLERIGTSQLAIPGQDTVDLNFSSYGDTRYDLLSTNFVKITPGDSLTFSQWPNRKVVGYDAYNSPDMPAISNQANPGATGKLYYNGLVVRDEDSGFDLAVNWNGELNGPNGAFLRTKDDTKSAWSKWRELLFKDYADTTYAPYNTETLQSVTSRGNSTSQNILFGGSAASSSGLSWNFNTDVWRIFVESPQDTPGGDMIFESGDNDQEGWIFRSKNATTPKQVLNIQPEGTFTFLGNNILHAGNHVAGSAFTPTLTGANVLSTITTNASGHVTALTTRALTAADIGAAPATASGNYIQNQTAADQSSSGFRISGIGRSNSQFQIVKDGSNAVASAFQLYNAASTRGANIQLDANTNPGLNFWVHDGTTWQNRLALEADGKVGIGTADPILGVHIKNSTGGIILEANKPFATTSGGLFEAYNSGTPSAANQRLGGITMGALTNGTELRPSSQIDALTAAAWSNDTSQSSYMRFMTTAIGTKQPSERMRIGADGNVGINNSNPSNTLSVTGSSSTLTPGTIATYATRISQAGSDLGIGGDASYSYIQSFNSKPLQINNVGNNILLNVAGGNVGIGTATPAGKLEVNGATFVSGGANLVLKAASNDPGDVVFTDASNVEYSRIYNTAGGAALHLSTGSTPTPRLTVTSAGNVGIATTAPSTTLHVNGSFRASGVADLLSTSYIRGIGAQDVANVSYIRFMDNTATFRKGYVGDASNGNNDMYLTSDSGGVRLVPLAGASGNLNVQGTSMDYNGGQLYLNNSTTNVLLFSTPGADKPTFSARSKGTKITLYPGIGASSVDYALGIDTAHMWSSIPYNNTTVGFKWYGGTTQIARLDGTGNLTLSGQVQATSFFQSSLRSLKKDIQPFTASALKIFEKVQVRTFKFKADASGKTNIGFIADEVPDEMATPQRNGVDQTSTVALLVKAVQELTEQNKVLQQKIGELEAKMKDK